MSESTAFVIIAIAIIAIGPLCFLGSEIIEIWKQPPTGEVAQEEIPDAELEIGQAVVVKETGRKAAVIDRSYNPSGKYWLYILKVVVGDSPDQYYVKDYKRNEITIFE